jgi:hypothetical protein
MFIYLCIIINLHNLLLKYLLRTILVLFRYHSSAIPVDSGDSGAIPVDSGDSGAIPAESPESGRNLWGTVKYC